MNVGMQKTHFSTPKYRVIKYTLANTTQGLESKLLLLIDAMVAILQIYIYVGGYIKNKKKQTKIT
jgi:hypothetical protein